MDLLWELSVYATYVRNEFLSRFRPRLSFYIFYAGVSLQVVVEVLIWRAVFAHREMVGEYTYSGMLAYVLVANGLRVLFPSTLDFAIVRGVQTGDLLFELVLPVRFTSRRLFEMAALAVRQFLMVSTAFLTAAAVLTGWRGPQSAGGWLLLVASLAVSFLLTYHLHFLFTLATFYTTAIAGLEGLTNTLVRVLSGALFPLSLLPDWMAVALQWTPFSGMVSLPVRLALNRVEVEAALVELLAAVVWILVLSFLGRLGWRRVLRDFVTYGG